MFDYRTSPAGISASVKVGKFVTIEPNCTLRSCRVGDFVKVRQLACCGSPKGANEAQQQLAAAAAWLCHGALIQLRLIMAQQAV
jgi:UDP-3-O-[3-hydroxymyristoyl] glucosamine N-acyltransferase